MITGTYRKVFLVVLLCLVLFWFNYQYGIVGSDENRLEADYYYDLFPEDHSAGLQKGINELHKQGGGILYFSKRTYRINDSLILRNNVKLMGAGRDVSRIVAHPEVKNILIAQEQLLISLRTITPAAKFSDEMLVTEVKDISPGCYVVIKNEAEEWPYDQRWYVHPGETNTVKQIVGGENKIVFLHKLKSSYPAGTILQIFNYQLTTIRTS